MFTAGFIKELTETVMGIFGFQTIQKIMLEKAYERLRKMEEERRGEGDPSVAEALVKRLPATEDLEGAFNLYLNTFSSLNVFVIDLFIMHTLPAYFGGATLEIHLLLLRKNRKFFATVGKNKYILNLRLNVGNKMSRSFKI